MSKVLLLVGLIVFVVVGGFTNFQINPSTDSSIQTSFTVSEILVAIVLLFSASLFYWFKIKKSIARVNAKRANQEHDEDPSQMTAPFRSRDDYRQATDNLANTYSDKTSSTHSNAASSTATISAFSGAAQYVWDGKYLSKYSGEKLLKFDGQYISRFAGEILFTWDGHYLSAYAGSKLYSANQNSIAKFAGAKLYSFDQTRVSEFAGAKLYSVSGSLSVPAPILIVIAEQLI